MTLTENVLNLPTHVSPSQISSWHQCGRRYLLERVVSVEEKPQGHFIGGTAVHSAIESALRFPTEPLRFDEVLLDELRAVGGAEKVEWRGRKTKAYPNGEDSAWWVAEGPRMVERALAIVEAEKARGFEILDIEAGYAPVIGGREFKLRADLVMRHPEGTALVIDWKTGQSAGDWAPFQLAYYAMAIEQVHGIEVTNVAGRIGLLRKEGAEGYLAFDPKESVALATQFVTDFTAGTEAGVYPLRPSALCKACGVRAFCEYGKTLDGNGEEE